MSPESPPRPHQRAAAERSIEAILEAAERLLERREPTTISAVAAESGISRVTVYSHFSDRRQLLEAVVERAVRRATAALEEAEPGRGPAAAALDRVLTTSWHHLASATAIAEAAGAELDPAAMRRTHAEARLAIGRLVDRGRREGAFRRDVPAEWLITSLLALLHAARAEASAGEIGERAARKALRSTIPDLFGIREDVPKRA